MSGVSTELIPTKKKNTMLLQLFDFEKKKKK